MGELIHTITSLGKLLDTLTNISLKPDIFRLSKLNKLGSEDTKLLWTVLHRLCCFSSATACTNDVEKCVASYLLEQGGIVAYYLPPDASPRQLLLCLGWMLAHGLVETNIDKLILDTPLGEELPLYGEDIPCGELPIRPRLDDPGNALKYATFLIGQIHHNLRAIANFRQERVHLLSKIHKETSGFRGLPQFSAGDIHLLTSPELVPEFLTRCRPCLHTFEAYSKWQRKSHVFWQWMISILKEESLQPNKKLTVSERDHLSNFLRKLEDNVRRSALSDEEENKVQLDKRRLCVNEDGKDLQSVIETLDSTIERVGKCNKRKQHEIVAKLSKSVELVPEAGDILNILNQFGLLTQKNCAAESCQSSPVLSCKPSRHNVQPDVEDLETLLVHKLL